MPSAGTRQLAAFCHTEITRVARSVKLVSSSCLYKLQEDLFPTLRLSFPCFLDTHIRKGQGLLPGIQVSGFFIKDTKHKNQPLWGLSGR